MIGERLAAIEAEGLLRRRRIVDSPAGPVMTVDGRECLCFASNDYLGLASDPRIVEAMASALRAWGAGAAASHFLGGHFRPHEDLERRLASFLGVDAALLFTNGYMANLGVITAFSGRGDAVFADRLNHASLIDAVRLSGADSRRYQHGDPDSLDRQLAASSAHTRLIATDSVFSMDGDLAPLPDLMACAERHDAWLLVDDAHAFGLLGPGGRGSAAHFGLSSPRLLTMGTLGKAAGTAGAFVAGSAEAIAWLRQSARTAIFTTAAPPAISAATLVSLEIIEAANDRRRHLAMLVDRLRTAITPLAGQRGWHLLPSSTPIQPLVIGANHACLAVSDYLLEQGIWVPAIRPPTVPEGQARLRISLSASHTVSHVDCLADALASMPP